MAPYLTTAEIRAKYIHFFESKGHLHLPSHSTIAPDPTTLFTVAGMQPFKAQFLGGAATFAGVSGEHRRITTAQKCVRLGDIENVGRTRRHLSLFEMLGNFSFGDYFKFEMIPWAWELLTSPDWFGLEADRLYITIYKDDDDAFKLWTDLGVDPSHIHRFDADENFWPADAPAKGPNGPCGPCSEIYYDRGPDFGTDSWADYFETRESARFLEIWNLVFPEFDRQDGGVLAALPFKNIDTGMGLERMASILQNVFDFYDTDTFKPIIESISRLSGRAYEGERSVSHRVIAEHLRSVSMVLADGTLPSNTGRGYVLRKVLRRAIRHAYLLGFREPVLYSLVPLVANAMGVAYPEMRSELERVQKTMHSEEVRFLQTLEAGIHRLDALLADIASGDTLSGLDAFTLYDTYGFPLDLTQEIAEEKGVIVDSAGFEEAYKAQQNRARAASKMGKQELFAATAEILDVIVREKGATQFVGYDDTQTQAQVLAIITGADTLAELNEGEQAQVVLNQTVFYAEGGGQVGDIGYLRGEGFEAQVLGTQKTAQGVFLHTVEVLHGTLSQEAQVQAQVDESRQATERHHTATHLLHAALRAVLGSHVRQAGSLVNPERLRFDFTHNEAITDNELQAIETLVNRWVQADYPVHYAYMPIDEARATGAMALFGEKYGDVVRVVSVEGQASLASYVVSSKELCGGCHVTRTGEIGSIVITADDSVAAGVRRLEAVTGEAAVQYVRHSLDTAQKVASQLNTTPNQLPERVSQLQAQIKDLGQQMEQLKRELTKAQVSGGGSQNIQTLGGFKVASLKVVGLESGALRGAADSLLDASGADIAVVAGDSGLVVKLSKAAADAGAHAGKIIGVLAQAGGGKGGGRPDMAQAGIKDPEAALLALGSAF